MEYMIGGVVFGLCLFILPLWAYRRGLKDGIALSKGTAPTPIQTPVQVIQKVVDDRKQEKTAKAQEDAMTTGLMNLLSYDGNPQPDPKKVGDK